MTNRSSAFIAMSLATFAAMPAAAQDLTPVTFGTNWVAQAEHGGYHQAVAGGVDYAGDGQEHTADPDG